MDSQKNSYGNIENTVSFGQVLRDRRKDQGLPQADLAGLCNVGVRFISDLERGKDTVEIGKTLQVLQCLGLELQLLARGWERPGV